VSLFKKFFGGGAPQETRLFVLSLDGVGHSFVQHAARTGLMPNLAKLLKEGGLARMNSVIPTVSTVAWATYMTGVNPGKHGIFGYVDREPKPFTAFVPTARDLKTTTLWEIIGRTGKRVGVINVPLTYPPRAVNGFMVGCFLSPELAKATYPAELAPRLMEMEYRIDADMSLARGDLAAFAADCGETMARRFAAAFKLMRSEPWEFFQLHVMSTDRINHFLWGDWRDGHQGVAPEFETFYRKLDTYLGELLQHLPQNCRLAMLSDHGFCRAKADLYLNHWLEKNGYLHFGRGKREVGNMHPDSRAYSLVPGRIYVNLEGREEKGRVPRGKPYEDLREELIHRLGGLNHPETNQPLVRKVFRREELYAGPLLSKAADLVVVPQPGYELKPQFDAAELLTPPDLSGAHTFDDAFLFIAGLKHPLADNSFSLLDVAPTLLSLMGVAVPQGMEGQALC
jgi:predicted AlkP superfamily phosphohydrolase/phosphomutase